MTEVRETNKGSGLGLYTTKSFEAGDIILEELPLFTFCPTSPEQIQEIRSEFQNLSPSLLLDMENDDDEEEKEEGRLSSSASKKSSSSKTKKSKKRKRKAEKKAKKDIQKSLDKSCIFDLSIPESMVQTTESGKFRSMLVAAASYALFASNDESTSSSSSSVVKNNRDNKDDDEDKSMSIPERIQKLCHPEIPKDLSSNQKHEKDDAAAVLNLAKQALKFLQTRTKPSQKLHEFSNTNPKECIKVMLIWACNAFSGGMVYETMSRVNHSCDFNCIVSPSLEEGKAEKQILRAVCALEPNTELNISYLGSFTYASRLTRIHLLLRDKYFTCRCSRCTAEEKGGDIAAATPCSTCHPRTGRYLDEDVQYDDDSDVNYALPSYQDNGKIAWVSKSCSNKTIYDDNDEVLGAMEKTIAKVEAQIERESGTGAKNRNMNDDDDDENFEVLERLSSLSSSILGAKHWTTNLLSISMLGRKLTSLHSTMLLKSTGKGGGGDDDDLDTTEIAECIDSLQRAWAFVEGLGMKAHPGHLLGTLTIGVARALVALGDVKSMKYGAEWAEKVNAEYYAKGFEGMGMVKVVETLINAWKRKEDEINDTSRARKKFKSR